MQNYINIFLLFILIVLLYSKPTHLARFSKSLIGRIVLITLIVMFSCKNITSGFYMLIIFVILTEMNYIGIETFDTSDPSAAVNKNYDKLSEWKLQNCKLAKINNKINSYVLDPMGNPYSQEELDKKFTQIEYINSKCNPCAENCSFLIKDR